MTVVRLSCKVGVSVEIEGSSVLSRGLDMHDSGAVRTMTLADEWKGIENKEAVSVGVRRAWWLQGRYAG